MMSKTKKKSRQYEITLLFFFNVVCRMFMYFEDHVIVLVMRNALISHDILQLTKARTVYNWNRHRTGVTHNTEVR